MRAFFLSDELAPPPLVSVLTDEAATRSAGATWANYLSAQLFMQSDESSNAPILLHLIGDLGAGKTTFCRGFLQALGHSGRVKSPSYTLLETYQLRLASLHEMQSLSLNEMLTPARAVTVAHFDLYRIPESMRAQQFYAAGFDEYLRADTICLIEWPSADLPWTIRCELAHREDQRTLHVSMNQSG